MRLVKLGVMLAAALTWVGTAWAGHVFVIDELVVTVRQEPSANSTIIGRVRSLQKLELIDSQGGWSRIRLANGTEGWIQSKYLVSTPPTALKLKGIQAENERLAAEVESLKAENRRLTAETSQFRAQLSDRDAELAELKEQHAALKKASGRYIQLKAEYERAREELDKLRNEVRRLEIVADDTVNSRRLRWFLAGGGVLIAGWLAGLISARRRRRTSKLY